MPTLFITDLEAQTLEAMKMESLLETQPVILWMVDAQVFKNGRELFGSDWGGPKRSGAWTPFYPTISATFGRLKNKGLVMRRDSEMGRYGHWALTNTARELLGLPLVSD